MPAWLIERLLVAPNQTLDFLPGGQARAEKLTTIEVGEGAARQTIAAWAVSGLASSPQPIWTDAAGRFFGFYNFIAWRPKGYESALGAMEKAQNDALATRVAGLSKQLARTPAGAVGKTADLVLVEGDPSRRIGDLRHTRIVMMDGRLMDADALRKAAGFSGRPKN